jgi:methylmalonyl-CoA mutase C-terminal domain/subunit
VQEDVAVIGLSFLSGDHMALLPKVMKKLEEAGLEDVKVIVGGIILPRHINALLALGIRRIFLPGTPMEEIVDYIKTA